MAEKIDSKSIQCPFESDLGHEICSSIKGSLLRRLLAVSAAILFATSVAACTGNDDSSPTPSSTTAVASPVPTVTAYDQFSDKILVASSDKYGEYLTDSQGRALYMFDVDKGQTTKSSCGAQQDCNIHWPLFMSKDKSLPDTQGKLDDDKLGVNASGQVFYGDFLLYYWWKDAATGDTNGQGVGGVWWLVSPDGTKITTK